MAKSNRDKVDIIAAAKLADVETLRKGVAQGADVERRDCDGMTALMCAAEAASAECLAAMIAAGGRLDWVDRQGSTALLLAAQSRSEACLGLLVEAGADLDAKDNQGRDVVYWAARRGLPEIGLMIKAIRVARAQGRELDGETPEARARTASARI